MDTDPQEVPQRKLDEEERITREIRDYAHREATHSVLPERKRTDTAEYQKTMKDTGPYATLGLQMAMSIALFAGAGIWLDGHFSTSPLWTAILTGIGSVLGLSYFIISVLRLSRPQETKRGKN